MAWDCDKHDDYDEDDNDDMDDEDNDDNDNDDNDDDDNDDNDGIRVCLVCVLYFEWVSVRVVCARVFCAWCNTYIYVMQCAALLYGSWSRDKAVA